MAEPWMTEPWMAELPSLGHGATWNFCPQLAGLYAILLFHAMRPYCTPSQLSLMSLNPFLFHLPNTAMVLTAYLLKAPSLISHVNCVPCTLDALRLHRHTAHNQLFTLSLPASL
jgi:hypothetical protein